jgi:hypothetical protein
MDNLNKALNQAKNENGNDVNRLLVAGLFAGDKVKYEMNYNGIKRHWDGVVIDTVPLTIRIKFFDGYVHNAEPNEKQRKFISK